MVKPNPNFERIFDALDRGSKDRDEMRGEIRSVKDGLQDVKLILAELKIAFNGHADRASALDITVNGERGLENRLFMAESQITAHSKIIERFEGFAWKLFLGLLGAALLGGVGSEIVHRVFDFGVK